MDPIIQNYIKLQAKEVYSEDFIKLRDELQSLKSLLNMDSKNLKLRNQYAVKYKEYKSARIQQSNKKRDIINKIMTKYPLLQHSDITPYIDEAILGPPEEVALTIPAVYPKPTRSDMAVLLVYFNACSYNNLERNLKLTYQSLIKAEIPVFLVEHLFKDQEPLFPENGTTIFNTRSDSYMFYKENLLNWLMPKVPAQFTKFYMMDCDLIFSSPRWYDDVSALLDTHDVVQPFQEAILLKSNLKTVDMKRVGIVYANSLAYTLNLSIHHPGFAWAFRREFIEPIGIFDLNILGSGDSLLASSIIRCKGHDSLFDNYLTILHTYFKKYYELFNNTRQTYYKQDVYHLWHGNQTNRWSSKNRYEQFQDSCKRNNINEKDDIYQLNSQGIYEFKESIREEFNTIILDYFKSRDEDGY
jgi:hypothetical protein